MTHFSLSARGRERDNFDIRVVARETMARVSEERKAKLWRLPFCNLVCVRLAVTLPCELRIIGWYFFMVKGVLIDDEV